MNYLDFKNKAILEDSRNKFGNYPPIGIVPVQLTDFFTSYNPIDVEVYIQKIGLVRFCSADKLCDLQEEYKLQDDDFVFATANGDPIFIHGGVIYISSHEIYKPEMLADSFDAFIAQYLQS